MALALIALGWLTAWVTGYRWRHQILEYDVAQYYAWLPATLVYHDWTYAFLDGLPVELREDIVFLNRTPDGRHTFNKMSMGLAYLYAPWYFLARAADALNGMVHHPFSDHFGAFILFGGMTYAWLGLVLLAGLLRRVVPDGVAAVVLLVLAFTTNLFNYAVAEGGMSHASSFFLFALALHLALGFYMAPHWRLTVGLGLVFGLLVLVRPTNILILIPVLFWGVTDPTSLRERFRFFGRTWPHWVLVVTCAFLVWVPQLAYWYAFTGKWIYYSYQQEGFDFLHPHILDGLLSYRKGWLVYTPVMFLALAGFLVRPASGRLAQALPVLAVYLGLQIWVIYSWHSWWYGGSFGSRPMVEAYVFLAFPLAGFLDTARGWHRTIRTGLIATVAACTLLNLFQDFQYTQGILHRDRMSREAYWGIFGKWRVDHDRIRPLLLPGSD